MKSTYTRLAEDGDEPGRDTFAQQCVSSMLVCATGLVVGCVFVLCMQLVGMRSL